MDRTSPPPFKNSTVFNLPIAEKIFSEGENEIWHIPSTVGEVLKIEVVFKAGKYFEANPGIAQFTVQMLEKGFPGKSADKIANELDYYGAHLELKAGNDFSSVGIYSLRKNLTRLIPLFRSIICNPSFPEEELLLYKQIFSENLKINLTKNDFVASNSLRAKIFGSHPYGRSIEQEDVARINPETLKAFYGAHFKPFKIFLIGRIEQQDIMAIQKEIELTEIESKQGILDPGYNSPTPEFIEGPNKVQASIRLGKQIVDRSHPDWPGIKMLNHILGGYFGSRLMTNIREEKGLTYSIHSYVQSFMHSSSLTISAEVNSTKADIALQEIFKEIDLINKITTEELGMAKNHLIASIQNDVTTVFAAAEKIKSTILAKLPINYYQDLITKLNNIEADRLLTISESHFKKETLSCVIVK